MNDLFWIDAYGEEHPYIGTRVRVVSAWAGDQGTGVITELRTSVNGRKLTHREWFVHHDGHPLGHHDISWKEESLEF